MMMATTGSENTCAGLQTHPCTARTHRYIGARACTYTRTHMYTPAHAQMHT